MHVLIAAFRHKLRNALTKSVLSKPQRDQYGIEANMKMWKIYINVSNTIIIYSKYQVENLGHERCFL